MAGKALALRNGWTRAYPAAGHFRNREFREDGCACVQPVASARGASAARRNHAGTTDLQGISQDASNPQSSAANRACKCRRGAAVADTAITTCLDRQIERRQHDGYDDKSCG